MTVPSATAGTLELRIAGDHPSYAGHFPGMPILPGVVLIDAALDALARARGAHPTCLEIKVFKFLSPVRPGDLLNLEFQDLADGSIRMTIRSALRIVAAGVVAAAKPRDLAP